jgi:hypothetical protein
LNKNINLTCSVLRDVADVVLNSIIKKTFFFATNAPYA